MPQAWFSTHPRMKKTVTSTNEALGLLRQAKEALEAADYNPPCSMKSTPAAHAIHVEKGCSQCADHRAAIIKRKNTLGMLREYAL